MNSMLCVCVSSGTLNPAHLLTYLLTNLLTYLLTVSDNIVMIVCHCHVDYKNDPYSEGDACSTICCRGDLNNPAVALGCYDTKVVS